MFHPCLASLAFKLRRAAPAAFIVTCLWASLAQSDPPGDSKDDPSADAPPSVEIFGKVVDDETGKPVEGFITQAGHFDPKHPKNVTWGYSETRNSSSSSFRATIKWNEGWTARILADGYIPQPVLSEAPRAGKERIETVIRLKKGRTVRGRVLDHLGKPVKDVSVFAIRSISLTLAGGKAVNSFDGEEDKTVRGVKTDAGGRFELSVGDPPAPGRPAGDQAASDGNAAPAAGKRPGLVVASPALDAWPAPLPEGDAEAIIRLPAPTQVEIRYDIEGSDEEATVFLQSVMHGVEAWKGFEIIRHIPISNKGRVELSSLPPGRYQFARSRTLRHGTIGQGRFLDRQFVEVASDRTTTISFERPKGARLKGSVEWDEVTRLTGVIISVCKVPAPDASPGDRLFPQWFDSRLLRVSANDDSGVKAEIVGNRGLFLTERIPPGVYEVHFEGYAPLTAEQERRTGRIGPTLTAQATVTVPESGAVPSLKVRLEKPAPPAGRQRNAE
jgi:hypothetical protein